MVETTWSCSGLQPHFKDFYSGRMVVPKFHNKVMLFQLPRSLNLNPTRYLKKWRDGHGFSSYFKYIYENNIGKFRGHPCVFDHRTANYLSLLLQTLLDNLLIWHYTFMLRGALDLLCAMTTTTKDFNDLCCISFPRPTFSNIIQYLFWLIS